jgi:hypothetical protein
MLRSVAVVMFTLWPAFGAAAEGPAARFGVMPDLKSFPQTTPKETLASTLKAIDLKRIDYLLAHLTDPDWIDGRVESAGDGFRELVKEAGDKLDPPTVKRLKQFLEQGEIETLDATAVVKHKDVKDRVVRLRKVNNRWYLRNANKP